MAAYELFNIDDKVERLKRNLEMHIAMFEQSKIDEKQAQDVTVEALKSLENAQQELNSLLEEIGEKPVEYIKSGDGVDAELEAIKLEMVAAIKQLQIADAAHKGNDDDWTADGKPAVDAINFILNKEIDDDKEKTTISASLRDIVWQEMI